jgi:heat shock protein HtpX
VIGLVIGMSLSFGWRLSEGIRWLMIAGWMAVCFGKPWVAEKLWRFWRPSWRRPIFSEEEQLKAAMREVAKNANFGRPVRFLIDGDPAQHTRLVGYRTILVHSGSLQWASDLELRGMLAHELGHLRDGDSVLEEAFRTAGVFSYVLRLLWRFAWRVFRFLWLVGLLLFLLLSPVFIVLSALFLLDRVFRLLRRWLRRWIVYRQDAYAFRAGFGDGLRSWLEKSGLAANAERIRRLERMAGLRD